MRSTKGRIEIDTGTAGHTSEPDGTWGRYWLGLTLSATLSLLLAGLSLNVLLTPNLGYGLLGLVFIAIGAGVPLAIALFCTWLFYCTRARGPLPGKLHAAMFLPTVLALAIIPVSLEMDRAAENRFSNAHPAMDETHVNLSGTALWLPVESVSSSSGALLQMPLQPGKGEAFVSFTRYPRREDIAADTFPYVGSRLREGGNTYTYASSDNEGHPVPARSLPLVRRPFPDLRELTRYAPESSVLAYHYFHYRDRVEVAPVLRLSGMTSNELEGKVRNLASFHLSNLRPAMLARLEINGQTLAIDDDGETAVDTVCRRANWPAGYALVNLDQPLEVRWQTLDHPQQWHSASVSVPAFRHAASRGARASWPSVVLYFTGNDIVVAERFQQWRVSDDKLELLATGLPAGVPADRVCGSAADGYDQSSVTVRSN